MLNQLQNSDIGSYDHFEIDLNSIAILPLHTYLELEKNRKTREIEENKSDSSSSGDSRKDKFRSTESKARHKESKLLKE